MSRINFSSSHTNHQPKSPKYRKTLNHNILGPLFSPSRSSPKFLHSPAKSRKSEPPLYLKRISKDLPFLDSPKLSLALKTINHSPIKFESPGSRSPRLSIHEKKGKIYRKRFKVNLEICQSRKESVDQEIVRKPF